jgi:cation diffusion facilitator family transporter
MKVDPGRPSRPENGAEVASVQEARAARAKTYEREVRRVTLVGVGVNVLVAAAQSIAGFGLGSRALVADAAHTLSDLVSDAVVMVATRLSAAPPDEDHPYGHGKFETLGTVVLALLLTATGLGIAGHAVAHLEGAVAPNPWAMAFAALCLFSKEFLYRYTRAAGARIGSNLLLANAWHHRSDAVSSLATLTGIIGAVLGYPMLDGVAAIVVAILILRMALNIGWKSLQELLDTSLEAELLEAISSEAVSAPGVLSIHAMRARRMGPSILVDMHIDLPGDLSLRDAHEISESVERLVLSRFSEVAEVLVHLDPVEIEDVDRDAERCRATEE